MLAYPSSLFICDGLKTGHVDKAGYGIVLTAYSPKTQRRIVCVLNGLHSERARKQECIKVLNWAFGSTEQKILHKTSDVVAKLPVRLGKTDSIDIIPKKNIGFVKIENEPTEAKVEVRLPKFVTAPLKKGTKVGCIVLTLGKKTKTIPLVIKEELKSGNAFKQLWHKIRYYNA